MDPNNLDLEFQEKADPQVLAWFKNLSDKLNNLTTNLKNLRFDFPKIYTVQGSVNVDRINMPPIMVSNFPDLNGGFKSIALGINNMQEAFIKAVNSQKLEIPKSTSINGDVSMSGMQDLLDGVEELKKGFNILIKTTQESRGTSSSAPMQVEIVADLPRPTSTPVTNVSLNGLGGFLKSTAVTVTSALTVLPGVALSGRRGVVIYNNGSQTMEIGGSTFTFGNGIPVAAGAFSIPIDASSKLIVYGRVASGSVDVRVAETSDINIGR
jgi:hypothetical protein